MADEDTTVDAPAETSSDASVPDDEVLETSSGEDEPEADDESVDEADQESDDEDAESAEADEPSGDDDDDEAWKNFQKKFSHLKSDRDRRAAMGKAFWEKTRYASQVRKENEEFKARLARLEAQPTRDDLKDAAPPEPPPELTKIDQRIQVLYQKDQAVQAQQNRSLIELNEADKTLAILEDRLKDADEYQKAILEQRAETAKLKREAVLNRWADLNERREAISLEMEQRLGEREWTAKSIQERATRDQSERQSLQEFNAEFPKHVDGLITSSADDLGAPKDPKIRQSLWRTVNRAMMVDLWQLGEKGLQQVNVPAMVRTHVKEYLEDRDLVGRTKFAKVSSEKLKVAGREAGKPARPVPAARPPVPPSLLSRGDLSPAMRRAREVLTKRFGG